MAITITPKIIPDAEIPYDKVMVSLNVSPMVTADNEVTAAAILIATPYRVLSDGTIDKRDDMSINYVYSDVFVAASQDNDLAIALQTIYNSIQTFLAAKGN